jgi:deazaflavin-dependent oxidoreductase (nitroreductase family)
MGAADPIASVARRLGATRAGVWFIGRVFSPAQRRLLEASGGRLSLTGRAPVLLLTTTGRRTGVARTVPLFYLRDGGRLVVCNVDPGHRRPSPWVLNLRANPAAEVRLRGKAILVIAEEASEATAARYWPRLVNLWPPYRSFLAQGGRRAIFVLDPQEAATPAPGDVAIT